MIPLPTPVVVCADGPTVPGIDVSVYQGNIDWQKVRASGVEYAFIRVSDGLGGLDSKYDKNWAGARAAGVLRGTYQFFREDEDPIAQADFLLDHMGPLEANDLPPVIDVESVDGKSAAQMVANIHKWVDRVQAATGRKPIIYSGKYFWNDNVGASTEFVTYPLWIPAYGPTCPDLPKPWADWAFFQHSDKGSISGITGNVDLDKWNGDRAALDAWIAASASSPSPGNPDAGVAAPPDAAVVVSRPDAGMTPPAAEVPDQLSGGCSTSGRGRRRADLPATLLAGVLLLQVLLKRRKVLE